MEPVIGPVAGISGGDHHDRVALRQPVHHLLICLAPGEAGRCGTQRQVHRIRTQNNGVLNGGHIV